MDRPNAVFSWAGLLIFTCYFCLFFFSVELYLFLIFVVANVGHCIHFNFALVEEEITRKFFQEIQKVCFKHI